MRLLLIEDEVSIRDCCAVALADAGFEVVSSLDITEIEALLPTVSAVISDFNMGLDFQAIRVLAERSDKPLLLMSGNPAAETEHDRFLPKPFGLKQFLASVRTLIAA